MAHCIETLLEEENVKTNSSEHLGISEFRKVYYRKLFHFTDNVNNNGVFNNDLHQFTRSGKHTIHSQRKKGSSKQESSSEDDAYTRYICKMMDEVTGTPAVVRLRQEYCKVYDELLSTYRTGILFTGSKAEGLDLLGSDHDFMYEFKDVKVVQSIHTDYYPEADFFIVPSQSNSCFVLLKFNTMRCCKQFLMMSQQIDQDIFLSSLLFTLTVSNTEKVDMEIYLKGMTASNQGPSQEYADDQVSIDNVFCFKCSSWPVTCNEWICRERQYNWPSHSLKRKIIQNGFHLVPAGHPLSSQREMEWRVSFSFAERELVWSFNHIQMHCYAFLKIVLKECIKPHFLQLSKAEMPLCSYFLKTLLFWTVEETKPSFWKPENLTTCFRYLLCTLHKHVISGHLSHYFLPDFNLFEIKVKGHAQQTVIIILESLLELDIECIMNRSETLGKDSIKRSQSNNTTVQSENYACQYIETFFSCIADLHYKALLFLKENEFSFVVKSLCTTNIKTEFNNVLMKSILSYSYHTDGFEKSFSSNKSLYKILQIHNMKDLEYDLTSTKLLHATRRLLQKDFHACLTIINHMFSSIPPYALNERNLKLKQKSKVKELFRNTLDKENLNMSQILSQGVILDLVFSNQHTDILPAAIQIEAKYDQPGIVKISPHVYSYYLMFLCYYGLGDSERRESALRMLIEAALDEDRCGIYMHHSLNIAGHCLLFQGRYNEARIMFTGSAILTSNYWCQDNSCLYYLRLLDK